MKFMTNRVLDGLVGLSVGSGIAPVTVDPIVQTYGLNSLVHLSLGLVLMTAMRKNHRPLALGLSSFVGAKLMADYLLWGSVSGWGLAFGVQLIAFVLGMVLGTLGGARKEASVRT